MLDTAQDGSIKVRIRPRLSNVWGHWSKLALVQVADPLVCLAWFVNCTQLGLPWLMTYHSMGPPSWSFLPSPFTFPQPPPHNTLPVPNTATPSSTPTPSPTPRNICDYIFLLLDNFIWQALLPAPLLSGNQHRVCRFKETSLHCFEAVLRLPFTTKDEACGWLNDFEESSHSTWRVSRTFPHSGLKNMSYEWIAGGVCMDDRGGGRLVQWLVHRLFSVNRTRTVYLFHGLLLLFSDSEHKHSVRQPGGAQGGAKFTHINYGDAIYIL